MPAAQAAPALHIALPLATSALFSGSYVAGKVVATALDPLDATLARYVVALAFLAALIPRLGRSGIGVAWRDLPAIAVLGLTGIVGYHGLFFASLRHTSAGNTAIINGLAPVLTALAAAALLGERLGARRYAGIALACAGALVLVAGGEPRRLAALDLNRGDLLMLGAVCCWVAYSLVLRRLLERHDGFRLTLHATLAGVLVLAVACLDGPTVLSLLAMSGTTLVAIAYMGLAASGLGYLLYTYSVEAIGPTRTSSIVYCTVPILVALLALAMLGEPLTAATVVSIGAVVTGLRLLEGR